MTTRALQIAKGSTTTTAAYVSVYTVPAGKVLVLKSAYLENFASTTQTMALSIDDASSTGIVLGSGSIAGSGGVLAITGLYVVLNAGDTVRVYRAGGTNDMRYLISGALLPVP